MSKINISKNMPQPKKSASMAVTPPSDVHFGDGVLDTAKETVNERMQGFASSLINEFFDYIESKVKDLPETIKSFLANPETKKDVANLWSYQLYEQGIIPRGYSGLSDELLIHNFHQDGYIDGMYAGYLITITALAENGVEKRILFDTRKDIIPKLFRKNYEDRGSLCDGLEAEICKWAETSTSDASNTKEVI